MNRESVSVFGESGDDDMPVLAREGEERLAAREARVAAHERDLGLAKDRLRGWTERLRLREYD